MTNIAMERSTMLLIGKPSISMGHFPWLCEKTKGYTIDDLNISQPRIVFPFPMNYRIKSIADFGPFTTIKSP